MKRLLLLGLALAIVLLAGCGYSSTAMPVVPTATPVNTVIETFGSTITYVGNAGGYILPEGYGISVSEVSFSGVYPGWSGALPLTIINGQDRERTFEVTVHSPGPSQCKSGYEPLPTSNLNWITVVTPMVTASAGSTVDVPIQIAMPLGSPDTYRNMEVRIMVNDYTQTGLVQYAVESRWYIDTTG